MSRIRTKTNNSPVELFDDLSTRVGRLEGTVESIQKELAENNRQLSNLIGTVGDFKDQILSKIGSATTPKWPFVLGAISLLLTFMMLGGGVLTIALSGLSKAIDKHDGQTVNINSNIKLLQEDVAAWKLQHAEKNAEFVGRTSAYTEGLLKMFETLEQRQFSITHPVKPKNR